MKSRSTVLAFAVASLFATAAMAQNTMPPVPPPVPPAPGAVPSPQPPPPPPMPEAMPPPAAPTAPPPPMAAGGMTDQHSSQMQANGTNVTVSSGMPAPTDYGPKPSFSQLDVNHNGRISHEEAKAYLLLYNDWLHVAGHGNSISKAQYARWGG